MQHKTNPLTNTHSDYSAKIIKGLNKEIADLEEMVRNLQPNRVHMRPVFDNEGNTIAHAIPTLADDKIKILSFMAEIAQ